MLVDDFDPLKGKRLQILRPNGEVERSLEPDVDGETLVRAYKTMILARAADEKAVILQRQGRLGAYPPNKGQEASSLGPILASVQKDWLVWAFRELSALLWKGMPLVSYFLYWMGNEEGSHLPDEVRITPPSIPVGSQIPHAVGISYASKLRGEEAVTFAYFGDGATSEGDFNEGLNFAGVLKTPTVFICQNNQYAISVPRQRQTAAATIAQKAVAYGFPGIQVDGNDILAMYAAAKEAAERARRGEGPTLIESYTYRLGDHTTSDDARRYRKEVELGEWEQLDPLKRTRIYLEKKKLWSEEKEEEEWRSARERVEEAVEKAESFPSPKLEDVFTFTYQEMPKELQEQLDFLRNEFTREG